MIRRAFELVESWPVALEIKAREDVHAHQRAGLIQDDRRVPERRTPSALGQMTAYRTCSPLAVEHGEVVVVRLTRAQGAIGREPGHPGTLVESCPSGEIRDAPDHVSSNTAAPRRGGQLSLARWARIIAIAVGRVGSDEIVKSDPDALAWIDHAYSPGAGDAFLDRMNVLRFTTTCEP